VVDAQGNPAAACDLKSADPIPEVGYWSSARHRGVMTNTVKALVALAASAGFEGLFARTRSGNQRSMAVLARAGFSPRGLQADGMFRYELQLQLQRNS
jgi:RimJ/RimL family protein N-acetyltransferase